MHDTDMAQRLYFARQFRFANDALEDWVFSEGLDYYHVSKEEHFLFAIVHCEADYYALVNVGDPLEIHLSCEHIGKTSFSLLYQIYREGEEKMIGLCRTVHVTLSTDTGEKIPIPPKLKQLLEKYSVN